MAVQPDSYRFSNGVVGFVLGLPVAGVLSLGALSGAINGKGLEDMLDFSSNEISTSISGPSSNFFIGSSIGPSGQECAGYGISPGAAKNAALAVCFDYKNFKPYK